MADIRSISGRVLEPRKIEKKNTSFEKKNKVRFKKICKKSHYPPRQKSSYKIVLSSRSVGFRLRNLNAAKYLHQIKRLFSGRRHLKFCSAVSDKLGIEFKQFNTASFVIEEARDAPNFYRCYACFCGPSAFD